MIGPMRISILLALSLLPAAPALSESLDGVWRSQGYGYVFEILGSRLKAFDVTSTTCVAGFAARLQPVATAGRVSRRQGAFFDVLTRRLPNGWTFGLPNEVCRTADGTAFDGVGIPPDINVPVFADADVEGGRDPAMEKAIEILETASQ
jgi:hypothetical protein